MQRLRLGWNDADVAVIDAGFGQSGAAAGHRCGFKDLIARVTLGEVGLVLSYEAARLARNCSDWYPLLDLCGCRQCLIGDREGVYDPGLANGRLLPGLKGAISEVELHTLRGRLTAGLLSKAERGDLALALPAGLARGAQGTVAKDPDRAVQGCVELVSSSFPEQRSAAKAMRGLRARGLSLPRREPCGDISWTPPTAGAVRRMLKNPACAGAFAYGRTRTTKSADGQTVCGIPEVLYTDHGCGFTSRHIEQVCAALKVRLIFSQVGQPRGRGRIERFFGTLNTRCLADLPGYLAPGGPPPKPGLTLAGLDAALRRFIVEAYNHAPHSATGQAPEARWRQGGFLPQMPDSLERLDLLLLAVARPRRVQRDGIRFSRRCATSHPPWPALWARR